MRKGKVINAIIIATFITSFILYLPYVFKPVANPYGLGEVVGKYYQPNELNNVAGINLSIANDNSDDWIVIYRNVGTGELELAQVEPEYYYECEVGDTVTISYNGTPIDIDWNY